MKTVGRLSCRGNRLIVYLAFQLVFSMTVNTDVCIAQEPETYDGTAESTETLPPPAAPDAGLPEGCEPAPVDKPLVELTTDIRPRDEKGELVPDEKLPQGCAQYVFTDERYLPIELTCSSCQPSVCELLQLARFCHRPLYFEDAPLERWGIRACCFQPAASAAHFYCNAVVLPIKMMRQCPCECVPARDPCD